MKKILLAVTSIVAYAICLSLGVSCLLFFVGTMISLEGRSGIERHPRFLPFCIAMGIAALLAVVAISIFNRKAAHKLGGSQWQWLIEMIAAVPLAIPMIWLWEMVFDALRKIF